MVISMMNISKKIQSALLASILIVGVLPIPVSAAKTSEDNAAEYVVDDRHSSSGVSIEESDNSESSVDNTAEYRSSPQTELEDWLLNRPDDAFWVSADTPLTDKEVQKFNNWLTDDEKGILIEENWETTFFDSGDGIPEFDPGLFYYMDYVDKDCVMQYTETDSRQIEIDWNKPEYAPKDENLDKLTSSDIKELEQAQDYVGDLFEVRAFINDVDSKLHHAFRIEEKNVHLPVYFDPNITVEGDMRSRQYFKNNWTATVVLSRKFRNPGYVDIVVDVSGYSLGLTADVYMLDPKTKVYTLRDTDVPIKDGYISFRVDANQYQEYILVGDAKDTSKREQGFYNYLF